MSMKRKAPYSGRHIQATRYPTHEGYVASIPPASPVIPMRAGSLAWMGVAAVLVAPHVFPLVLPAAAVAAANPVIAHVRGQLVTDRGATFAGRAGYFPVVQPAQVYPAIPLRTGHFTQDPPPPLPAQGYQRVTYFQEAISPANPIIPLRSRPLSELRDLSYTRTSSFSPYTYTDTSAGPANPLIAFKNAHSPGLWPAASIPRQSAYGGYEFISTFPAIPMRSARVDAPAAGPANTSAYFKVPAFQGIVPPSSPAIPLRVGQWIREAVPPRLALPVLLGGRFGSGDAPEPEIESIIIIGGDDAPRKKRKTRKGIHELFQELETTVHGLLHPVPAAAGDDGRAVEVLRPDDSGAVRRALDELVILAQGQHDFVQRAAALRAELKDIEDARARRLEQDDEDALIWLF